MSRSQNVPRCPPSPTTIRSSAVGDSTAAWPLHLASNPKFINGPSPSQHYFNSPQFTSEEPARPTSVSSTIAQTHDGTVIDPAPTAALVEAANNHTSSPSPPPAANPVEQFVFYPPEKHESASPVQPDTLGSTLPGTASPPQGNSFEGSHTQYEDQHGFPAYPEKAAQYPTWGEKSIFTGVHGWEIPRAPQEPLKNHIPLSLRTGFDRLYQSWIDNWWLWELLSWTIAAVCMGLIALILVIADNRAVGDVDVTLNAIISILSGIAKAALLLPVAEALGQLKWSWFWRDTKKVEDFETFDNASRGPWGSLVLLWRTKGRTLAAFGAVIVIVSVALDPFFQQLVTYPQQWVPTDQKGTLPQVLEYHAAFENQTQGGVLTFEPDSLQRAYTFPYIFGQDLELPMPHDCPTSNCSWEKYETLSICSACHDVSDLLTWACLDRKLDWLSNVTDSFNLTDVPTAKTCGYWLNATSSSPVLMTGQVDSHIEDPGVEALQSRIFPLLDTRAFYDPTVWKLKTYWDGSIHFKDTAYPLFDFIAVNTPGGAGNVYNNGTPEAQECVLSWCVKQYSARLYMGNLTQTLHETFVPKGPTKDVWQSSEEDGPVYLKNFTYDLPGKNLHFEVGNLTIYDTFTLMAYMFPMTVTSKRSQHSSIYRYPALWTQPITRELFTNAWDTDLVKRVEGMARVMSSVMTTSFQGTRSVYGTAWADKVYVKVRWEWLIMPFTVLALSLLFLLATIFKADREKNEVGIWKTSALATLMNGLRGDVRQKMGRNTKKMGEMRHKARQVSMKLTYDKKGYRLSGLPGAAWASSPATTSGSARGGSASGPPRGRNWI